MINHPIQITIFSCLTPFQFLCTTIGLDLQLFQFIATLLLGTVLALTIFLAVARIVLSSVRGFSPQLVKKNSDPGQFPSISIHIPFCNETSANVIATLKSCMEQHYSDFEVIVMSRNSQNRKAAESVRNFCKNYSEKIHFENSDQAEVINKGDALDICREVTGKNVKYIFTLDACYVLDAFALRKAVRHLKYTDADLLQFPLSYKTVGRLQAALHQELSSYFEIYCRIGNLSGTVLPTGAFSLIKLRSLDRVKGWTGTSITKDAELGVKLWHAGMNSTYIPEVLGHGGRMPGGVNELLAQRAGWIFGNFQTLIKSFQKGSFFSLSRLTVLLQLTAWINLLALPLLFLLLQALLWAFGASMTSIPLILAISCIAVHLFGQFVLLGMFTRFSLKQWVGSFLIRTSMLHLGAFQWIPALFNAVTPVSNAKFSPATRLREVPLVIPGLFLILFVTALVRDFELAYLFLFPFLLFSTASLRLYLQFKAGRKVLKTQLQ